MKQFHPVLLSLLTGLLLFAAWPVSPFTFLIFVAFIPLLWLERQGIRRRKFFGWVYLSMLVWNVATTWWVWNASAPGAIGAFLANSLLMCLPWLAFHFVNDLQRKAALKITLRRKSANVGNFGEASSLASPRSQPSQSSVVAEGPVVPSRMGDTIGYASFVVFWLSFEYFHLQNWGLSWPWLTLGNVFASSTGWIQWYEYTGTSGGGLWVLVVNILLFRLLWDRVHKRSIPFRKILWALGIGIVPILVSNVLLFTTPVPNPNPDISIPEPNIVIVQPNIDPYEKISTGSFDAQLHKLMSISDTAINDNTVLVVWPETALYMENGIEEDHMKQNYFLNPLWDFLRRHPQVTLLTGVESFRNFKGPPPGNPSAYRIPNTDTYVETYNAAVLLDSTGALQFYHKSRLVPGVETLPPFLHILDSWFEKFGGTTSGYTGQPDRTPFSTPHHSHPHPSPAASPSYRIAPAVCYESIYGEFMSQYVRNGADLIAIITNDGWWGNTPGYRQHESYARLRAIETRRWVVRSANTGVSCIIDPTGAITRSRPWDQAAAIRETVPATKELTFYVRYGDCLSKIAILLAILFFAWNSITFIKTRFSRG